MRRRKVIEKGPLYNRINWAAFFEMQSRTFSFENKFRKNTTNKKVKRLAKTR